MVSSELNFWLKRVVYLAVWVIEVVMFSSLFLWLMAANPGNALVRSIYGLADTLASPIASLFPAQRLNDIFAFQGNHVIAALFYAALGMLMVVLINILVPRRLELRGTPSYSV